MNIALIGYGKMGKAIEQIALSRGHQIVLTIDLGNMDAFTAENLARVDVAIEFTSPHSTFDNLKRLLSFHVPVVCGSTGWLDKYEAIEEYCLQEQGSFLYASNFSVGVNIFFEVNKRLAELMAPHPEYAIRMEEIHHTQKKDAPSGTAVSLAEQILQRYPAKKQWVNHASDKAEELAIISERIDPAPGTHKVLYSSAIDDIEIIHTAHSRTGFATGAVLAAEFLAGKKGIYTMKDVLGL
ncbi:4-hydroxy-tetrahydrodipicolinate reductase [Flavihumibacter petaseus]|uniref:4-hydroxy-tetrahydrodipicolinate reductase n=1 Tax=Flavihumibacter petaseus NBRC 106054 TaxID=1220578 RepID=A0A0E9MZY1_9BACT|nr:4-hydroxy-tetrahydrodipicolinate reductase [Flavihumibacter petaseus]GAO43312.1 dihydrodipicolinate reductase [Flavihumibacter petaseus NBRC 106054]